MPKGTGAPTGARSPVRPEMIDKAQRREKAIQLRLAGATFDQIAEQCGFTDRSSAYAAVRRGVQRIGREQAEELFDVDNARLDRLLMAVWPKAMQGDLAAVDRVLAIMQRRARMLGYDGVGITMQTQVTTDDGKQQITLAEVFGSNSPEIQQRLARMLHDELPAGDNTHEGGETDGQG